MNTLATDTPDDFDLPYPVPAATYRARLSGLRDALRRDGVDGLLAVDQSSLYYLFGYDQIGYWVFQAVWIPADPEAAVRGVCRAPDRALMSRGIGIDSVEVWLDDDIETPAQRVVRWIVEDGAERVAIEIDNHALRPDYAFALRDGLADAGVEVHPDGAFVTRHRELKDAAELNLVRRAAVAVDDAFAAIRRIVEPGRLETELASVASEVFLAAGCDPSAVAPCISAGRRTMFQTHLSAKPLPIPEADVVTVELGAALQRYHAVGYRTFFTEGAPAEYIDQYEHLQRAVFAGIAELRPGAPSTAAAGAVHAVLDSAGSSRRGRHVGYATGIGFPPNWLEDLRIKSSQDFPLQVGMTFFLFAGAPTLDDRRHIGFGLPVAVVEDGVEILGSEFAGASHDTAACQA